MGYSCSRIAGDVLEFAIKQNQASGERSSNVFTNGKDTFFVERGRENYDGAVTGTVHKFLPNDMARRVGTFRIESNGNITRFHGLNAIRKDLAEHAAKEKQKTYPKW